jgi:2-keto-4-pentenoate hydratase
MTSDHTPDDWAARLWQAEQTGTPARHITADGTTLSIDIAYAIQRAVDRLRITAGDRPVGRKIGLASYELQRRGGTNEPFWAHVFAGKVMESGATLECARFLRPRLEPEIAVVLGHDLTGPQVTKEQARAAIAAVRPAVEIVDVRTDIEGLHVAESIADGGWNAGAILGPAIPVGDIDLDAVSIEVFRNAARIATGNAGLLMDGPAGCLAWLARFTTAAGLPLRAGEIVLTGTMAGAPSIAPGETLRTVYRGLGDREAVVEVLGV